MQRTRIGPFALEETLDGLAESNVLRGIHVERKVSMAIKLLPKSLINRPMGGSTFPEDVKQLQRLIHPGIARCYGGAVDQGQPYLALELVEGESLWDQLDRRGRLPWEMIADIVDSVCEALQHAHREGFVHGRLTPRRILLPESGETKLVGFDCAWADRDDLLGLRSPMEVAHYVAPEVFRGKQSGTLPTTDLFSLGVILFQCLSGEYPWPADTPAQLVEARRAAPAERVSAKVLDCPVWLDVLVSKLLARKRVDRLASAEVTHSAIVNAKQKAAEGVGAAQQALAGKSGALAMGASQADRAELKKIRRRQTHTRDDSPFYERAWFLALCLAAVIGGAVWSLWPASEAQLWAKAAPLMQSDSAVDWRRAKDDYLSELLQRFPETEHRPEIEAFELKYAMNRAEERIKNLDRFGRTPETEAERLYAEARRYERFGDRVTAWQRYEGLVNLLDESDDLSDRAFVELAKLRIGEIRAQAQQQQQLADFVAEQLAKADELAADNQTLAAREVLTTVISLYDGNQELEPLVDKARQRKAELDGR